MTHEHLSIKIASNIIHTDDIRSISTGFTMFTQHQGPDGSFGPVWARNSEFLGSNPGRVGCFHQVVHTGLQCSKLFKGLEYAMLSVAL